MAALVGIVLVSHSPAMAAGLGELLGELGGGVVTVVTAAGTAEGGLGTCDALVRRALAEADAGAGAVVLADLGSAVLTARTVLDEPGHRGAVLVDAPFVEGAVAAVVTASTGAGAAEVARAAEAARDFRKL